MLNIIFIILFIIGIDVYFGNFLLHFFKSKSTTFKKKLLWGYVVFCLLAYSIFPIFRLNNGFGLPIHIQFLTTAFFFILEIGKLFAAFIMLIDDHRRGVVWIYNKLIAKKVKKSLDPDAPSIPRSEFLIKTAAAVAAVPISTLSFGILSGAHDYRIHRKRVEIPSLPSSFHGIKILQLSDIHSGSFYNKKAVLGGIEMAMNEKADIFCFTGDLVNSTTPEVNEYIDLFKKIKAPLGSFSVTGNHDYGDYVSWKTSEDKKQNFEDLKTAHKLLGWDLLLNTHRKIQQGGDTLVIAGVENWGNKGKFPKYGKLNEALEDTEDAAVRVLLSHDPSHWDGQVRESTPHVDLMLAGHTHGFQFGVEIGDFRWSPVSLMYKQWADLHTIGSHNLYVNRGFGYIGYPGRVGILPEITVLELVKS